MLHIEIARVVSEEDLVHGRIHDDLAGHICGALAWQSAEGVKNDGWLNVRDEPILSEMLDISAVLDRESDLLPSEIDRQRWRRLLELASRLQ